MIYLYYSDSKEKDLVEGWANYGTKMGFTTCASSAITYDVVSTDYINTTITQDGACSNYPWNYVKSNNPWKSNYIIDPLQLEAEHRKVKQIIKFKPI